MRTMEKRRESEGGAERPEEILGEHSGKDERICQQPFWSENLAETEKLEQERQALFYLTQIPDVGAVSIRKLREYFGSFSCLYNIEETDLRESRILREKQILAFLKAVEQRERIMEQYGKLAEREIRFVTPLDKEYPCQLLQIYDYPMGLYVRGKLPAPEKPVVAIVGARGCSEYGQSLAAMFAQMLSEEGTQIISGLALGIDGAAHRGALKAGADTYGVMGCGVNICYPSAHYKLYGQMIEHGGIISEFPLDTRPDRMHFPMRNRIISGLADAILVVEAKEKSGSLITAEFGLDQGKEIFAIPGRITDHLSGGCNRLIQQGAHMAISPNDILEYLGVKCRKRLIIHEKNVNALAKPEKMVYACLDFKAKHLEEISGKCGMSISACMGILLELELQGYVFRAANHYYGKKI